LESTTDPGDAFEVTVWVPVTIQFSVHIILHFLFRSRNTGVNRRNIFRLRKMFLAAGATVTILDPISSGCGIVPSDNFLNLRAIET
jgi:hypothetical protein